MRITQLNHIAIHVDDVAKSSAFYADVLGLATLPRPGFKFPGAWFRVGVDQELHLIGVPPKEPATKTPPHERHYAFMVDDIEGFASKLREQHVEFRGPNPRPDGAQQIFLRDPDGHVIELCTPPAEG